MATSQMYVSVFWCWGSNSGISACQNPDPPHAARKNLIDLPHATWENSFPSLLSQKPDSYVPLSHGNQKKIEDMTATRYG